MKICLFSLLARRRRDFFWFSDFIQGKSIRFSPPQARNFWDLGTLFSEIVDFFVEIVDFFTEIVDTHLFVERVPGGLDNRRHVSTIH